MQRSNLVDLHHAEHRCRDDCAHSSASVCPGGAVDVKDVPGITTWLHSWCGLATHSSFMCCVTPRSAVKPLHGSVPSSISTSTYSHDHRSSRRPEWHRETQILLTSHSIV